MYPLSATSLRCTDVCATTYPLSSTIYSLLSIRSKSRVYLKFVDYFSRQLNASISAIGCILQAVLQGGGKNIECWFFNLQLGIQVILDIALTLFCYLYLTLLVLYWPQKCNSLHAQYYIQITVTYATWLMDSVRCNLSFPKLTDFGLEAQEIANNTFAHFFGPRPLLLSMKYGRTPHK